MMCPINPEPPKRFSLSPPATKKDKKYVLRGEGRGEGKAGIHRFAGVPLRHLGIALTSDQPFADFSEAMSMENRYFTSLFSRRSYASLTC